MDTGYETVVDPSTIVWTMTAVVIHVVTIAIQLGVATFLIGTGLLNLFAPDEDSTLLRRLGAIRIVPEATQKVGGLRLGLGIFLFAPLAFGAPFVLSLLALVATLGLLVFLERGLAEDEKRTGRITRRLAIACSGVLLLFTVWEGEDALALGVDVIVTANGWRAQELEWQLANDLEAPKVGERAPDFALQDPAGVERVRLSQFYGKRPVALIFGSYT